MRRSLCCLVLAIAWLTCVSPAYAQEDPADTISAVATQPTDAEIERRLNQIFAEVAGLHDVSVSSEAGVITLGGQVVRPSLAEDAERFSRSVEGVVTVQNDIQRDNRFQKQIQPLFDRISDLTRSLIVNLPLFLLAALLVGGFWWLGSWIAKLLYVPKAWAPNLFVDELVRLVIRMVFALIGFLLAAELLGATALLVSVLGGLGVVGLALGFAIRDTVENFVASVLLSIRQPFGANEHVVIDGNEGRIMRLTSRATIMLDLNGNHVRVPNSVVYKSIIVNYSHNPKRRFQFDVGIDTDVHPPVAQALAVKTLSAIDGVLSDPVPTCIVSSLGDSNVVLRVYAWVDQNLVDFLKTRSAAMSLVKQAFEAADINMPEPIYRLRVENVETSQVSKATIVETQDQSPPALDPDDIKPDTSIEKQVDENRDGDDLLNRNAPRE